LGFGEKFEPHSREMFNHERCQVTVFAEGEEVLEMEGFDITDGIVPKDSV
jgi:hypothetical protein